MAAMPADDLAILRQRAADLTRAYNRSTWYRFAAVFIPIPFAVVLLRLQLEAWHYMLAGGLYVLFAGALYTFDSRAAARCDAAEKAMEAALRRDTLPDENLRRDRR